MFEVNVKNVTEEGRGGEGRERGGREEEEEGTSSGLGFSYSFGMLLIVTFQNCL